MPVVFTFFQQFPLLWKSISISERKQGILSDNNPLNPRRSQNQNTVSSETLSKQRKSPQWLSWSLIGIVFGSGEFKYGFVKAAILSEELVVCLSKCQLFTLSFASVFARDILKFQLTTAKKTSSCVDVVEEVLFIDCMQN